jgi:hypothetical protein
MRKQPKTNITHETLSQMSRLAGFEFSEERCKLLAPQLISLLSLADALEEAAGSEEPLLCFSLIRFIKEEGS